MTKVNVLIIGSGHYATGTTSISGQRRTDKDRGVLLPSALGLRARGLVDVIGVAARDGAKLVQIRDSVAEWAPGVGWDPQLLAWPSPDETRPDAYVDALREMPRPCVALIAVPDHVHVEVMQACIAEGVPFLIVKPAVTTLDDFYGVRDAMNERGVFGMVDYHKVFDDMNVMLRAEYRSGAYGRLYHASSLMTQRRDMIEIYRRWFDVDPRLNINHYLGSHYAHLVGFITGAQPIDVRAFEHMGWISDQLGVPVADAIDMQVRWQTAEGHIFTSSHVSGWSDPPQTESMTYQEIHLLCENGHVDSDQRFRGTRKVLVEGGYDVTNPYFFGLQPDAAGALDLDSKYGFKSIRTFVEAAARSLESRSAAPQDAGLPAFSESEGITAILEAADISIREGSRVVDIERTGDRLVLR